MTDQKTLTKYTAAFVDELIQAGTNHVVISPGSRSTPLALLFAEHPRIKTWLQVDERSAAFFALGLAKAKNEPVAILCTSGTAAANYYPAVIEAKLARIPLIVLTADRPHEFRDSGAPQTIDQVHLFGTYPKWFADMALPEATDDLLRYARISAARAVAHATNTPAGAVHLNFPFREPLTPDLALPSLWERGRVETGRTVVFSGERYLQNEPLHDIAQLIANVKRGLIVCGPMENTKAKSGIVKLAEKLHFPILADPLSQLRTGSHAKEHIIESYDAFLRAEAFTHHHQPEVILRFGAMPVSKPLLQYIESSQACRQIIIDAGAEWRDPTLALVHMIHADPAHFCHELVRLTTPNYETERRAWLKIWQKTNAVAKAALREHGRTTAINEGQVILEASEQLPDESLLFVGNSMPIRDVDTFFFTTDKKITTLANRGANGIDGVVSSALGASTHFEHSVLIIGDLSFFHDLNGLLTAKLHRLNLTIILINNDGGGIFSFLPQAEHELTNFERLFGTPIGLDFEHSVSMYEGHFERVTDWNQFRSALEHSMDKKGLRVIEVMTDREENVRFHDNLFQNVAQAIEMDGV